MALRIAIWQYVEQDQAPRSGLYTMCLNTGLLGQTQQSLTDAGAMAWRVRLSTFKLVAHTCFPHVWRKYAAPGACLGHEVQLALEATPNWCCNLQTGACWCSLLQAAQACRMDPH